MKRRSFLEMLGLVAAAPTVVWDRDAKKPKPEEPLSPEDQSLLAAGRHIPDGGYEVRTVSSRAFSSALSPEQLAQLKPVDLKAYQEHARRHPAIFDDLNG